MICFRALSFPNDKRKIDVSIFQPIFGYQLYAVYQTRQWWMKYKLSDCFFLGYIYDLQIREQVESN